MSGIDDDAHGVLEPGRRRRRDAERRRREGLPTGGSPPSPAPARASAGPWPRSWPAGAPTSPCPTSTRSAWPRRSPLCEGRGVKVTSQRVDVADRDAVYAWADQVVADHGKVNLIFNNAGVALGATIEAMSYEDFEWLMNINFWGVVHGTKAFLPHLKAAGEGHVVNLSSVFGLHQHPVAVGLQRGQVRRARLHRRAAHGARDAEQCGVSCTTVHPGGIKTNIARNARMRRQRRRAGRRSATRRRTFDKIAMTTPGEGGPPDPRRRRAATAAGALIGPDAKVHRPHLPPACRALPAGARPSAPGTAAERRARLPAMHGSVTVHMDAPPEKVWDLVSDVTQHRRVQPRDLRGRVDRRRHRARGGRQVPGSREAQRPRARRTGRSARSPCASPAASSRSASARASAS